MSDLGNILNELKAQTQILLTIQELLIQTGGGRQAESDRAQPPCKADQTLPPRQDGTTQVITPPTVEPIIPRVPWKYHSVHDCVFNFMISGKSKRGMGLTREHAAKATRILKRQGDWTPPKLGALLYAFAQDPLPDDPFTFAGGCLNGKSAAREDFERHELRAAELLRAFEIRVAKDTGAENVEVQDADQT